MRFSADPNKATSTSVFIKKQTAKLIIAGMSET
jgi:hypothetical protein